MKTNTGFSSLIFFTAFALILISISRSHDQVTSTSNTLISGRRDEVSDKGLSAEDYQILRAMMGRCVDIYANLSSTPSAILQEDDLEALKLDIYRCNLLFNVVSSSFSKNGRLTPDYVHKLKDEIPNEVPPIIPMIEDLIGIIPMIEDIGGEHYGTREIASKSEEEIASKSGEDFTVLKPMMENCVKIYLDNADGGADSEKENPDLNICGNFFHDLGCYYAENQKQLSPESVAVLKEHRRLYNDLDLQTVCVPILTSYPGT